MSASRRSGSKINYKFQLSNPIAMPKGYSYKKSGTKRQIQKKKQFDLDSAKEFFHVPYLLVLGAVAISSIVQSEILTLLIFLAVLVIFAIKKYDSRIPIGFALILLVLSAVELAFASEAMANTIAIYAYYYLVVGVLLQLIEYVREKPKSGRYEEETD